MVPLNGDFYDDLPASVGEALKYDLPGVPAPLEQGLKLEDLEHTFS